MPAKSLDQRAADWARLKASHQSIKAWGAEVYALAPEDRPFGQRGKYPKPPYRKDEHGHHLCRWCAVPLKAKNRWWCGDACVSAFLIRGDWKKAAAVIQARDQVCQICNGQRYDITEPTQYYAARDGCAWTRENGWRVEACRLQSTWAVDHIVAVKDGGTDDPRNLRLLCGRCHREVTAAQHARWAQERRRAKHGDPAQQDALPL